jgi:hypothetical protein
MTQKPGPPPAPRRNPLLLTLDVIAGVAIIAVTIVLALVVLVTVSQYPLLQQTCTTALSGGVACSPLFMNTVVIVTSGITVFAAFIGAGMFIVRLIRKRLAFVWPLVTFIVIVIAFYGGTYLASLAAAPTGATS